MYIKTPDSLVMVNNKYSIFLVLILWTNMVIALHLHTTAMENEECMC